MLASVVKEENDALHEGCQRHWLGRFLAAEIGPETPAVLPPRNALRIPK